MKNTSLKRDLEKLMKAISNIKNIRKGRVSGNSIEIEFIENASVASYIYYEDRKTRNSDLDELLDTINNPSDVEAIEPENVIVYENKNIKNL